MIETLYRFENSAMFYPTPEHLEKINERCTIKCKILKGIYEVKDDSIELELNNDNFYSDTYSPFTLSPNYQLDEMDYLIQDDPVINYKIYSWDGLCYVLYKFTIIREEEYVKN